MNGLSGNTSTRRLSRETRHLLIAALAALIALWILARVRFPDSAPIVNPIPPLLTQLSIRPGFAELEAELARLQTRLAPSLVAMTGVHTVAGTSPTAVRIDETHAVAILDRASIPAAADLVAADRRNGLAVVRVSADARPVVPVPWPEAQLRVPRYFLAASVIDDTIAWQPVIVGALTSIAHPAWSSNVWRIASAAALPHGTMLFTHDGELVGGVTEEDGQSLVVPGVVLLTDAQRMIATGQQPTAVDLGVEVTALRADLRKATGADHGVVVSLVRRNSPLAQHLLIGDVVQTIGERRVESLREWLNQTGELTAGRAVTLGIVRAGEKRSVSVTPEPSAPAARGLGLTLRTIERTGAEVVAVEAASAGAAAGVLPGDLIVAIGRIQAPSALQVTQAFAAADTVRPLILGVTRGDDHHVFALVK